MNQYDMVIRGGTIADGTGAPLFSGDIALSDGVIQAVGTVAGSGREEIDAAGMLVTPGFVDIHSHFDGQVTWDTRLTPSSGHGVTTVLMGNCGVGFAPCRPDQRDAMINVMEGIEDIPGIVMAEGIPWKWESFPEFMDFLDTRTMDVDFAVQVPHIPVRVYVMGQRAIDLEYANPQDIAQMTDIVRDGIRAGALGFTSSRAQGHRTASGEVPPSTLAGEDELLAIAQVLREEQAGMFCAATDFFLDDQGKSAEFELLYNVAKESGRPVMFPLLQHNEEPDRWKRIADATRAARDEGLEMFGQVVGRPVGVLYGLECSSHPFTGCLSYQALRDLPLAEQVAAMRDPAMKAKLLAEEPHMDDARVLKMARSFHEMFRMGSVPNYSPAIEDRIDKIAERLGIDPAEVAYDIMLEDDGHSVIYHPARNFAANNLDDVRDMVTRGETMMGLADGGAHLGRICDASMPTFMLTYWTRDRAHDRIDLSFMIRRMTLDTATVAGLHDRGVLKPGYKADLNIIDYDDLTLFAPHATFDLPAGGRRLAQFAKGYRATIVSGTVTYRDGEGTGALPGRLIRGMQAAPAADKVAA